MIRTSRQTRRVGASIPIFNAPIVRSPSGAGKTSLLNCLCGRAYYGRTEGTVVINGQEASIGEIQSATGFVPQDDIV